MAAQERDRAAGLAQSSVVQTVDRALTLLEVLSGAPIGYTPSEISAASGIHRTVVYRLLATLQARGFVERDPKTQLYRLGSKLHRLASPTVDPDYLVEIATPVMLKLGQRFGETVWLAIRRGSELVGVQQIESEHDLRATFRIGWRRPITRGSAGPALLAHLHESERRRLLRAARTPELEDSVIREVEHVHSMGYAEIETPEGVAGISVAILVGDAPIGVLSIIGPSTRFGWAPRNAAAHELLDAARTIGSELVAPQTSDL